MSSFRFVNESRQSIRKYDSSVKIDREDIKTLIKEAMFAPSSLNLQPVRFLILDSLEGKDKIKDSVKFNKQQLDTCSAMVLVYGDLRGIDNFDKIYAGALENGTMTQDAFENQREKISNYTRHIPVDELREKVMLDAGMIIMNFMLAARSHGYDTCPIGGFDKDAIMNEVGIVDQRYFPILLISLGKAAEEGHEKLRLSVEDVTTWL